MASPMIEFTTTTQHIFQYFRDNGYTLERAIDELERTGTGGGTLVRFLQHCHKGNHTLELVAQYVDDAIENEDDPQLPVAERCEDFDLYVSEITDTE